MKIVGALKAFDDIDEKMNRCVYTKREIGRVLSEEGTKLTATIQRLEAAGVLSNACRNVYVYEHSRNKDNVIYQVAVLAKSPELVFESLESAAAQWGISSQVPISTVTMMTTGRSGVLDTPYGRIEYTHTDMDLSEIAEHTKMNSTGALIADEWLTARNLRRCNRLIG